MSKPKYYKLNPDGRSNMFWDHSQENESSRKIVGDMVAPLEETKTMLTFRASQGIVEATEKEYNDYLALDKKRSDADAATFAASKAKKVTGTSAISFDSKKAEELHKNATATLEEANNTLAEIKAEREALATEKAELEEAKAAAADPALTSSEGGAADADSKDKKKGK